MTLHLEPARLDGVYRPGNSFGIQLTWPDDISTRTFTATLGDQALNCTVDGNVLMIAAGETETAAEDGPTAATLEVVETTSGGTEVIITGQWRPTLRGAEPATTNEVTVTSQTASVAVSVVGGFSGLISSGGSGTPIGPAGGVLAGSYPNPAFAQNMATQAELDAETTARLAADSTLSAAITGETARAQAAETAIASDLADEAVARTTADSALDARLDTLEAPGSVSTADIADGAVTAAKVAADVATQAELDAEAAARAAADTSEATARAAGDALKVSKAGDTMTGPLVLPGNPSTNLQAAPKQYVDTAVAALVAAAPGALDTLNELAAALGNDPNFATTITTALAGKQPLDSDLTAIAALTTTAFGRSVLELANAAAGRTLLGLGTAATAATGDFDPAGAAAAAQAASQPVDSDLTAIAALTTTAFGRSFLELANAAAGRTLLGLGTAATAATGDFDAAGAATAAQTAAQAYAAGLVDDLSGVTDAATARTNLGLGTAATQATSAFQASDAELTALAGLVSAANKLPYFTGAGAAALADLTAFARTLLDDADAATARGTLGLGTAATAATGDFDAAGAAAAAQAAAVASSLQKASNLSDLANAATARTNLGLGTAATQASSAFQAADTELTALAGLASAADTLPYFTGSGTAGLATFTAFGRSLVDDADASAARTTLGLGTAATQASTAFDAAGAAAAAQAYAVQRANHTGTQLAATISDLTESVQDIVGAFIAAGSGITVSYNDADNVETISIAPHNRQFVWYIDGAVAAGNGLGPIYRMDADYAVGTPSANVKVAPVTTALTFDIQTADSPDGPWTSIFSVLPTIAAGSKTSTPGTVSTSTITSGKYVRFCITAPGGTPAQSITASLRGTS